MSAVLAVLVIVMVEDTVLAVVARLVLGGSAKGVVGEDRADRVADEADLAVEAPALLAPHKVLVDLIGAADDARHRVLVVRRRGREHRYRPDRYRVVRNLRRVHARRRHVEAVRAKTVCRKRRVSCLFLGHRFPILYICEIHST